MNIGLRKYEIEDILKKKIEKDPDLKYFIDDDATTRLIDLLVEGVAEAIDRNNRELDRQLDKVQ